MNLLANPCFQIAQRGASFNLVNSGVYTLDRWVSLADGPSRINIKRSLPPLGCEIEFNTAGYGGVFQPIERDQVLPDIGKTKTLAVTVRKSSAGPVTLFMGLLAWGGTVDKPTLNPIAAFGSPPTLATGWSIVAWDQQTVSADGERHTLDVVIPDAQNLAAVLLFHGAAGDWMTLHDASLDCSVAFGGYVYADELRRCSWFFQYYPYETLMNAEWGLGRKDPGGFVSFQFPLSYPLRGRLGGAGVYDIDVDWPVSANGYWHYGGGAFSMFGGKPTFTCHHRHFILLTIPAAAAIGSYNATVFRHWQAQPNAYIAVDAELQP